VRIFENTSWSCSHQVERWRRDCGCNSGGRPEWNQAWREPLRESLDWLRDALAPLYEENAGRWLKNPWEARNDYIEIVLDRSPENIDRFLMKHASGKLGEAEKVEVLKLLGIQRCAMLMYTSCGWFFDELSGIETVQVLQYAGRALRLAEEVCGVALEPPFLDRIEQAKSNIPEHRDGRLIYEKFVKPGMIDMTKVAAHYAVSSIFEEYAPRDRIFCFSIDREDFQVHEVGNFKLAHGRARITSGVSLESARMVFAALHFGEHNISAGVQPFVDEPGYERMSREVSRAFHGGDLAEVIRSMDRYFGASTYSVRSLLRDEQRRVLNRVLESSLESARSAFQRTYSQHAAFMHFLIDLGSPLPEPFPCTAAFVLNSNLKRELQEDEMSVETVRNIIAEAGALRVAFEDVGLEYTFRKTLERLAQRFYEAPEDTGALGRLASAVGLGREMPFEVNLWTVQNIYYEMEHTILPERRWNMDHGDVAARDWVAAFVALGRELSVRVAE
jgi:hypothetical protein